MTIFFDKGLFPDVIVKDCTRIFYRQTPSLFTIVKTVTIFSIKYYLFQKRQ